MESNRGSDLGLSDVFGDGLEDVIEILLAVFVGALLDVEEELVVVVLVGAEELIFLRDPAVDLDS